MLVDEARGDIELDAGFSTSQKILTEVAKDILMGKCGYPPRNILLLGFGQGGMAALHLASNFGLELGGVVSIGGRLPASSKVGGKGKSKTPVLVCGGSRSSQVTKSAIEGLKERFVDVEYVKWDKREDSMMKSREEALPVMKFFARRLRSRAEVPEGAIEV